MSELVLEVLFTTKDTKEHEGNKEIYKTIKGLAELQSV